VSSGGFLVSVLVFFSFFTCTGVLSGRQVGWRGFGAETASHNFFTTRLSYSAPPLRPSSARIPKLQRKRTTRKILAFRVAGLNCVPPSSRKTNPSHGLWVLGCVGYGIVGPSSSASSFVRLVRFLAWPPSSPSPICPLEHTAQDPIGG
jgi:hypothetical protein